MKKGILKQLVTQFTDQAGSNVREAHRLAANKVGQLMDEGKLSSRDFTLRQLYEELVDVPLSEDAATVAEALNTSAFPTFASTILHRDIIKEYEAEVKPFEMLVTESKARLTTREKIGGFEAMDNEPQLRPEAMAYEETDFGEKFWEVVMADFGRMISITRETIYEDHTNEVMNRARNIGRAAGQHKARMIIQTLEVLPRVAFNETASNAAIYKGTALTQAQMFSADHTAIDGVVNDNLATTNPLETYQNIDNAMQLFAAMVDEGGNKINITPRFLVVPRALVIPAYNIMNTTTYMVGGGDTHDGIQPTLNPIRALGNFNVVDTTYLASNTGWYLGNPADQMKWLTVYAPATASQGASSELAFTNQIVARFRFSYHGGVGHSDYRHIVRNTA